MPTRVLSVIKEWKEIVVLLSAVGGLYIITPKQEPLPNAAALQRLTNAVDSLNNRVTVLSAQINALVRVQCAQSEARALDLAGVPCFHRSTQP